MLGIFSEIFQSPSDDSGGGYGETEPFSSSCIELIIFYPFLIHGPAQMQSLGGGVELARRRTVLVTERCI